MKKLTLGLTTMAALVASSSVASAAGPEASANAPVSAAAPVAQPGPPPAVAPAPAPVAVAPAPQPQAAPYPGYVPADEYYYEEEDPRLSKRERRRQRRLQQRERHAVIRGPVLPPAHLPYHENTAPPPGYVVQETGIRPLIVGGAISLAVPYLIGITGAVVTDFKNETGWLAIPVVGPWIAREARPDDKERRVLLGLDGIFQGAGTLMLVLGLTITKKELVRNDLAKNLWVAPTRTANGGYGFAMGGQF